MIDQMLDHLRQPRVGIVILTGAVSLMMSVHWWPLAIPSAAFLLVATVRPGHAARPSAVALLAACWFVGLVVASDRMEDHVPLFAVWLVALAVSLTADGDEFVDRAAWHARMLIGVAFAAAVAWKLYFGTYVTGVSLWSFMLIDGRFAPLAFVVGLSDAEIEQDRNELRELLAGNVDAVTLDAQAMTITAIVATSILTLLLEAVIALSHLLPDASPLARVRLPSVVLFAVVTYAVVPVMPFAALLSLLAMTAARWQRGTLWVLPVLMFVSATRLATLIPAVRARG
ncbi:hypothetical protein EXE59_21190 [Nocardioides eburneiflavus]|uniref:Uncharacterized protein n=1 Tax=Nocardioides eburneiflavus TaxID=2518372 RepID=A0A4Z1CJ00_9ACTN|nr:hypothetical protein [Nocardioides eburneiflavus]TGN66187.1 hypothetical protein EXE59_21190 [Nocardioides eburneiflavus]